MKPFFIPVARFKENPGVDVWMETDTSAANMDALIDSIWSGSLFFDEDMRQLHKVYRLDPESGSLEDWTGYFAAAVANLSLHRREPPSKTLRLWLDRFHLSYFTNGAEKDD